MIYEWKGEEAGMRIGMILHSRRVEPKLTDLHDVIIGEGGTVRMSQWLQCPNVSMC